VSERTYGGRTWAELFETASAARRSMDIHTFSVGMQRPSQSDTLVLWDAVYAGGGLVAYVNNGPAMAAHIAAANPATVLALLDDLARIRAAARAFCEERTETALIALMSEVER
jgi:hypothetical protein